MTGINKHGFKFSVLNPNTMGNPGERFLTEIRDRGWLVDYQRFETKEHAQTWAENHLGKMSNLAAQEYIKAVERHENK